MKAAPARPAKNLTRARLRALVAVVETGGYSAAARRLGVAHTSVAQQIRELEAEQGVHLFDRVGRTLAPTPLCEELHGIGLRILDAELDAERLLSRRDAAGRRHLRVGLGNAMPGMALVAQVVREIPSLSVSVISGSHQRIMQALVRREIDAGVLPDVPRDPRFRVARLVAQEVVAIAHPEHPLAAGGRVALPVLARQPLIFRTRGSSTQKLVDRAFKSAGLEPTPVLMADTRDAVTEAVALGVGIGFMWRLGTNRIDAVRRIAVPELSAPSQEVVFVMADERNVVIDLFLGSAERFATERAETLPAMSDAVTPSQTVARGRGHGA